MNDQTHRSAFDIRIAFKVLTQQRLARSPAFEKVDDLWDEANRAAVALMETAAIGDYVALLNEMDRWYRNEQQELFR